MPVPRWVKSNLFSLAVRLVLLISAWLWKSEDICIGFVMACLCFKAVTLRSKEPLIRWQCKWGGIAHFCEEESFVYESLGCREGVRDAPREGGGGRWGKLSILSRLSGCLTEGVMTGRTARRQKKITLGGEKNSPAGMEGFLESSREKTNMSPNANGRHPTLPSLVLSFSRVAGLHQEAQHQLSGLGRVRGVYVWMCSFVCVCVSQLVRWEVESKEWNARVIASWLTCRLKKKKKKKPHPWLAVSCSSSIFKAWLTQPSHTHSCTNT